MVDCCCGERDRCRCRRGVGCGEEGEEWEGEEGNEGEEWEGEEGEGNMELHF